MTETWLLHRDPYENRVPLEEQKFLILKVMGGVTPEYVDRLPRSERIVLYLRCYRSEVEAQINQAETMAALFGAKPEPVDVMSIVRERAPHNWKDMF